MKVMVVEDYDDTREFLGMLLKMKGCHVVEAKNGREAVELAKSDGFALILMDLGLPILDGIAATRQILARPSTKNIPIVAVSAHCCQSDWKQKALDAGARECVEKPIDVDKLSGLLKKFAKIAPTIH